MNYQLSKHSARVADYFLVIGGDSTLEFTDECDIRTFKGKFVVERGTSDVRDDDWLRGLPLQASVVDRYPAGPREDSEFPSGIFLFCFPNGMRITKGTRAPQFHSFVHTSENGVRILGCCLTIYEPLTNSQLRSISRILNGSCCIANVHRI